MTRDNLMQQERTMKFRLGLALLFSLVAHGVALVFLWYYPLVATALGLYRIEFVEEAYNRAILIDFFKPLAYPAGYIGFRAPEKAMDLDKVKAEEERRRRLEAARQARERAEAAKREAEQKAQEAKAQPTPAPTPRPDGYGAFGKINTAPIKDQVLRLYEAKKAGKLVLDEGRLRVGVAGKINPDGSLADCKVIVSSGNPDIDRAALAILDAVSESRALGPLHNLTSLSMILDVDQTASLSVVGFSSSEQDAANIVNLAQAALWVARFKKAEDPAAMVLLNNLKVSSTGQRVQAQIIMPRQTASEALAKTMEKGQS